MGFRVFYSDEEITTAAGFGRVARFPCIFDSRPGYHRLGSRYLIDRGLAAWHPTILPPRVAAPPSDVTMKNYADWLANFLEWADIKGVALKTCNYADHILEGYQKDMVEGRWSRDGAPLGPNTVNPRVQQACDFLSWMAFKGYREKFDIPFNTTSVTAGRATSSSSHESFDLKSRKGKVRKNKRRLRMPSATELLKWLKEVELKYGEISALMCEMILSTAVRRAELASWRIDTLPADRDDWHISNPEKPLEEQQVLVTICFGTKGPCYGYDHGDKIGPDRNILVPLGIAERLHAYRTHKDKRTAALKRRVSSASTASEKLKQIKESVHLFLDEQTGERISAKKLYDMWTGVELPYKGWSPHLGRDWWACTKLWKAVKRHEELIRQIREFGLTDLLEPLLNSTAMSTITLEIMPQLGHANIKTTMDYLQWLKDAIGSGLSVQYEADLEREHHSNGAR